MESEAVDDIAGPLLKPLGVDGAPFSDVGEWLLPFSTADKQTQGRYNVNWVSRFGEAWRGGGGGRDVGRSTYFLLAEKCVVKIRYE